MRENKNITDSIREMDPVELFIHSNLKHFLFVKITV